MQYWSLLVAVGGSTTLVLHLVALPTVLAMTVHSTVVAIIKFYIKNYYCTHSHTRQSIRLVAVSVAVYYILVFINRLLYV
jgi:hypothetical protein